MGIEGYSALLRLCDGGPAAKAEAAEKLRAARGSTNWRAAGWAGPFDFDLARQREGLAEALRSRLSAAGGQKARFFAMGGLPCMGVGDGRRSRLGEGGGLGGLFEMEPAAELGDGWMEGLRERREPSRLAVCAACGGPGAAQRCGGCRAVFYCGRECQWQDWRAGHKAACSGGSK